MRGINYRGLAGPGGAAAIRSNAAIAADTQTPDMSIKDLEADQTEVETTPASLPVLS
jgi:hypothetical protein